MRPELLWNPLLLLERLGEGAKRRRKLWRLRNTVARRLRAGHIDSLELLELLRNKPPKVIYDVGANVGTWTLLAKAIFPDAEVHAFEPLSQHVDNFWRNTRELSNVHLHAIALGNQHGEQKLNILNQTDASSFLDTTASLRDYFNVCKTGEECVVIQKLDEFAATHQLRPPDLIKLDVQGYELEVLRGGTKCLHAAANVLSEVSFVILYKDQCLFPDLVRFLREHSFALSAFGTNTALGRPLVQADVIFRRSTTENQ